MQIALFPPVIPLSPGTHILTRPAENPNFATTAFISEVRTQSGVDADADSESAEILTLCEEISIRVVRPADRA